MSKFIIYIDDEEDIGPLIEDIYFPIDGFEFKCFASAKKAIDFINTNEIAGVISDLQMPEMNGTEVCKHISADIPFAIITGNLDFDISKHDGVDMVLSKPLEEEEFEKLIELFRKNL